MRCLIRGGEAAVAVEGCTGWQQLISWAGQILYMAWVQFTPVLCWKWVGERAWLAMLACIYPYDIYFVGFFWVKAKVCEGCRGTTKGMRAFFAWTMPACTRCCRSSTRCQMDSMPPDHAR